MLVAERVERLPTDQGVIGPSPVGQWVFLFLLLVLTYFHKYEGWHWSGPMNRCASKYSVKMDNQLCSLGLNRLQKLSKGKKALFDRNPNTSK